MGTITDMALTWQIFLLLFHIHFGLVLCGTPVRPAGGRAMRQIYVPSTGRGPLATTFKETLNPLIGGNKFLAINEKPRKYELVKLLVDTSGQPEECCGNDRWLIPDRKLAAIQISSPSQPNPYPNPVFFVGHEEETDKDVKPVTENIEDDLKYDFRTQTHSLR